MTNIPVYGTHYPILAAAVQRTSGPVLELGCGHFSTPLLHFMCMEPKRHLVTVESDKDWMGQFLGMASETHSFIQMDDPEWVAGKIIGSKPTWGVAFVDHSSGEKRNGNILLLKDKAEFIVVHDTENPWYGYESVFSTFKYRSDWRTLVPWTTVISMTRKFEI